MIKKVIVTGCNGQLGIAVNKEYANDKQIELINTDVAELDITKMDQVMQFVKEIKPYAIINCAAHTGVDACETERDSAFLINAIGPRNLSIAAEQTGAKIIQISTDYVFSGDAKEPYTELDPTSPQGVYGKTKLAGEQFVKDFSSRYFIIRTAWLYGEGKNFVKTMLRLAEERDEVAVVGDQIGSPTSAKELAKAVKGLLDTDNYGVFHGTCEGVCSWADFAADIFRLAGKHTKVNKITSAEFSAKAPRPAYSVLDNYMLRLTTDIRFADWQTALADYIHTL